jgi:hypothetical protein
MSMIPFANFTKGELAPELQARIDTSQYGAAAKRIRNFIIQRYGGLSFRPGFRLVGEVDDADVHIKYVPFQYNMEQAYIMALQNGEMRLLTSGGFVIEDSLQITAITKAANAQVTAAYHGYTVGQRIYFNGITGMTELNNRHATVVSVVGTNDFTIDIDTTDYSTFVSSTGIVRGAPPSAPPADPTPPTPGTAPPAPPPTTDGGGSGGSTGELPNWRPDYKQEGEGEEP